MRRYHDTEWGVPQHSDRVLFEYIVLDSFQAGLSWKTILYKRRNFKKEFADFDTLKVSQFTKKDFQRINKEQSEKGKKTLVNAIIGIVIVVLAWVIINVVTNLVGYNNL